MIYIFKGCAACFDIPAQVCNNCGKACDAACKGVCHPIGECVRACCDALSGVCSRPLGCYVLLTIVMSMLTFMASVAGFAHSAELIGTNETTPVYGNVTNPATLPQPAGVCPHGGKVLLVLGMFAVIALINIFTAFYVQHQTWEGLRDIVDEEEEEARKHHRKREKKNVADIIIGSSGRVFCYDICFCFNIFFLIAQFCLGMWGAGYVDDYEFCNPNGWPSMATRCGMMYPVLVVMWSIGWVILLHLHSCLESCCSVFGPINCCWGNRPQPRTDDPYDSDSDDGVSGWRHVMGAPPKRRVRHCCCCIPI